jgi:uridine kinase
MRIIGLTGASGSGKSTIAAAFHRLCLEDDHTPQVTLLPVDAYYRDLSHLTLAEREQVDFDQPSAIEFELLAEHLAALRRGLAIPCPCYDFSTHTRVTATDIIAPTPIVLVEGLLLGAWEQVSAQVDSLVFVDTPLELCLARRLERDSAERGRTAASITEFWESRAVPGFRSWSARAQEAADVVISGELPSIAAAEILRRELLG